ncbi:glycosyltransferase family 4 protein [Pannonibacter tanglangensis]|uniref:Glycosyltransferase n=1 Tax=Pannonibacter tanglangensis TaxID=2750084 RepID=A0ABW9ZE59_9HYPH|nr:glycosyltransferase family 1 protein [Pannonibacter sp. XCT-34]NBN62709.1 glycosyltransferase [Pannonibacter sp. XCT-34]
MPGAGEATHRPATRVLLDITRLMGRGLRASPTGIDRVEFAYLDHLIGRHDIALEFVEAGDFGLRLLPREVGLTLRDRTAANWGVAETGVSAAYGRTLRFLGLEAPPPTAAGARSDAVAGASAWLRRAAGQLAGSLSNRPEGIAGAIYINVAHSNLTAPALPRWLQRSGVRPVFLIHDLIPITHPEYCRPGHAELHRRRMATVATHADLVITNSAYTRDVFLAHVAEAGLRKPRTEVALLGIEAQFQTGRGSLPAPAPTVPYFVVLGTIEPRKNHLLLLPLWRDMVERLGPDAPRLVLVGRRGWENENVVDYLDRCPALRAHVHEAGGLTDAEVAALMRGAAAVLVPSFVEGFSLPLVEAEALGADVIASDIAVHREVAGAGARLLSPLDGLGWLRAIEGLARGDRGARLPVEPGVPEAMTWPAHFRVLDRFLTRMHD